MKADVYQGDIVLTKDLILAASCQCKSGSDKKNVNEKLSSVCVHGLSRAFGLSNFLVEALAEHTLFEFGSKVTSADVETTAWSGPELKSIKASILTLAAASGDASIKDETDEDSSLYDIM